MKLETFFEKFDQFAAAPDAIPAVRELILQLAVRGNLTERIGGESSEAQLALADAFRVRRAKREEPDAGNIPFPIPENWGWVAVGDSMQMFNGRAFRPEEWSTDGTPIVRIQNLNNKHAPFNRCNAHLDPKFHIHDGDFLISWSGTPGTSFGAFIWNRGFAYLNQHIFRCELVKGIFLKEFLRLAINARLDEMISHAQGAVGLRHITKGKLESIRLPLPPLAEQKRIVAKVDELMALCDRLETQQQERETRYAALARASLARFADAPTPANLQFLFHPSYVIPPADLRKSILTLAVQGKLVPQDPNDKPAITSLDEIEAEKAALIDARKLRPNRVTEISQTKALQYEAPDSWRWFRLGDVAFFQEGPGIRNWQFRTEGIKLLNVQNIVDGKLVLENTDRHIATEEFDSTYRHFAVEAGDILFASSGASWGKTAWFEDPGYIVMLNTSMVRLKFYSKRCDDAFLLLFLRTEFFKTQMEIQLVGIQPNFGSTHLGRVYIPLPPLAEQRRIVSKVEELMALVDKLEAQLAASGATAANLLSALVAELTGTTRGGKVSVRSASSAARRGRPKKHQPEVTQTTA